MSHKPGMECVGADVQIESLKSRAELAEAKADRYEEALKKIANEPFLSSEANADFAQEALTKTERAKE